MRQLVILLMITIVLLTCAACWLLDRYEAIIESQAETIRILQEQVIELRSRLFEFRAMVGGVG
jgi:Tfp pilus assembly protein PilN